MTLKGRISINVALAFSVLFGLAGIIIYLAFASFRKVEFQQRLESKALTTVKLLLEVKEVDKDMLKKIDQNNIDKLFNEKTIVFDDKFNLVYSSVDDTTIQWKIEDLKELKNQKSYYRHEGSLDEFGIFYDFEKTDYYVFITAEDKYGISKLSFLLYALVFTFLSGIFLVWVATYYFIRRMLKPLDDFEKQITNISVNKLNIQLPESNKNDEISLLTTAFNQTLLRIESAFDSQKEFTANASHEIRTPLARISFQVESLLQNKAHSPETFEYLNSIQQDVNQLSDLINSLLLLSKISKDDVMRKFKKERIDEIIFSCNDQVKKAMPDFKLDFEIKENDLYESNLEIFGVRPLLEIAFSNLLKNACIYSKNKHAEISIEQIDQHTLKLIISNNGKLITASDSEKLFQPFHRGENAQNIHGSGLGLRITKRILDYHQAQIVYLRKAKNTNSFEISFSN